MSEDNKTNVTEPQGKWNIGKEDAPKSNISNLVDEMGAEKMLKIMASLGQSLQKNPNQSGSQELDIKKLDANKDGVVTKEEYQSQRPKVQEQFLEGYLKASGVVSKSGAGNARDLARIGSAIADDMISSLPKTTDEDFAKIQKITGSETVITKDTALLIAKDMKGAMEEGATVEFLNNNLPKIHQGKQTQR